VSTRMLMNVRLVSVDGKPISCQNKLRLNVHCAVADICRPDIFIVTSIHDVDTALAKHGFMIDWLKEQHRKGTVLASVCTGAFLLAETGLLDGREATTHWSMADLFRKRYPRVHLKSEKLVINSSNLYCSGGAGASTDLAYLLLEKHMGHKVAARTAKYFIHDFRRISQNTYEIYEAKTEHNDIQVLKAQHWITKHLHEAMHIADLCKIACMSERTFERRFKNATGDTPTVYVQRIKVEAAKYRLETTNWSFDEIAYQL
jgi:transcriptional regulator GlxA family with amidase domain